VVQREKIRAGLVVGTSAKGMQAAANLPGPGIEARSIEQPSTRSTANPVILQSQRDTIPAIWTPTIVPSVPVSALSNEQTHSTKTQKSLTLRCKDAKKNKKGALHSRTRDGGIAPGTGFGADILSYNTSKRQVTRFAIGIDTGDMQMPSSAWNTDGCQARTLDSKERSRDK
jgi:hypothetical protein